jgi:hypothetical protein
MKLKRKSKVGMWMAEKRHERLIAEAWLKTEEGREWLKQWRANREERQAEVRRMLDETVNTSDVLKEIYPDDALPGPIPRVLW